MLPQEKRIGITYSAGMHITLLLLAIVGLPTLFEWTRDPEPQAITVDIVPIGELTNLPNNPIKKEDKKEEVRKQDDIPAPPKPKEEKEKKKPVPDAKKEEPKKAEPVPDKKKEKEKDKPKKDKKEKEKEKQKKVDDALEKILKGVEESAKKSADQSPDKKDGASDVTAKSDRFDPTMPLSISEKDMIRSQIEKHWSPPIGAKDAHELKVMLRITVMQDGRVANVEVSDMSRYMSDGFFRAAADSAVRAVYKASPLQQLDPAKFQSWKEMELVFDPRDALY